MSENEEKIAKLQARLENLVKSQAEFQREVYQIRNDLHALRIGEKRGSEAVPVAKPPVHETTTPGVDQQYTPPPRQEYTPPPRQEPGVRDYTPSFGYAPEPETKTSFDSPAFVSEGQTQLEKFIGENLISKLGIGILVIGVGIGAKYAIDNNLISPLTRIILGYVMGLGLIGVAIRLKPKYLNFSAVLLSGGMAIMYFITYFAYSLYQLIDQRSAFVLMLIFTAFTISAALVYSRQVIAHIGLVGAYAIPFLLSNESGNYAFLFSYIGIINAGILAISVRKYWKPLFYTSFIFTWAIYFGWLMARYAPAEYFSLALSFLLVFFLIFYVTFLIYKVMSEENIAVENIGLVTANAFIFYGLGYVILDGAGLERLLGLFTISNAAIHLLFAVGAGRLKHVPLDLIYLLSALVLTFVTISVPVQFDGNQITLIWTAEAAILFWIGRTRQISLYEFYSFPLMVLATVSLYGDWFTQALARDPFEVSTISFPFLNGTFVGAAFYLAAFAAIWNWNRSERFDPVLNPEIRTLIHYAVGAAALFALYNTFRIEIGNYFHYRIAATAITDNISLHGGYSFMRTDGDLANMNYIWQINYTMLFLSALTYVNLNWAKDRLLSIANVILSVFTMFLFVTLGLYLLSELRDSYLLRTDADSFARGSFHIVIRYVSYVFVAALLLACYAYSRYDDLGKMAGRFSQMAAFDFLLHVSLLIISSSELLHWMDMFGYPDSHKLGLSIWWGVYALALVVLGINSGKQYLRIGAIVLLGITLAKLFLYDISELSTVARTVVFVSLGILMLIVSFLYNKYKSVIFGPNEI